MTVISQDPVTLLPRLCHDALLRLDQPRLERRLRQIEHRRLAWRGGTRAPSAESVVMATVASSLIRELLAHADPDEAAAKILSSAQSQLDEILTAADAFE